MGNFPLLVSLTDTCKPAIQSPIWDCLLFGRTGPYRLIGCEEQGTPSLARSRRRHDAWRLQHDEKSILGASSIVHSRGCHEDSPNQRTPSSKRVYDLQDIGFDVESQDKAFDGLRS